MFFSSVAQCAFFQYTKSAMFNKKDDKNKKEAENNEQSNDAQKSMSDSDDVHVEVDNSTSAMNNDFENLDDSVVAEEAASETVKKLREKLKKCEAEKTEYLTGWQRAKADFINARKRDEEERKEYVKFANERLIDGIIPVLDSFEMAMGNKEAWEKADKNWRIGVEYILGQLKKALADSGLEEIDPTGKKFDPMRDEAAEYVAVDSEKDNHIVISVIQKGYSLHGRQMRPPKVKVGEFKSSK